MINIKTINVAVTDDYGVILKLYSFMNDFKGSTAAENKFLELGRASLGSELLSTALDDELIELDEGTIQIIKSI
jgi:hypothetical protein